MSETNDELDPPFEIIEPAEWRGPVVFNSPHSGSVYPRAFLTASRLEVTALRRSEELVRRRACLRRGGARIPADAGALSALLRGRQPRALRARSPHVRGPPALLCQYPLDAGRGRAGHRGAGGGRRAGDLRPAHPGRRRDPAHRGAVQALPPRPAAFIHARAPGFRRRGADRLSLHALDRRLQG